MVRCFRALQRMLRQLLTPCLQVALALALALSGTVPASAADPETGPGGPILVVTNGRQDFGVFYAEILRTEGFSFAVSDVSALSDALLASFDVVLLAKTTLSPQQVTTLQDWVGAGGRLIAMAPDAQLTALLGITPAGGTVSEGYLQVVPGGAGAGVATATLQFHGNATRYALSGAAAVAQLFSSASTPTGNPAVTLRTGIGGGSGQAAAFAYDLATSIVYTRQGNPAWAASERDGFAPIRSDDKFYGNAAGDVQPDWVDLAKVAIPQADEQQRLLANLIVRMTLDRKPMPRLWYFPKGKKAVVVMTGDDHANGGTAGRFDRFLQLSPAGCSVADWECIRGTSYIYANTPLGNQAAASYVGQGFEIALHLNTGCNNFTPDSLANDYTQQLSAWRSKYTLLPTPATMRHHCIVWSDWSTAAQVQSSNSMRLDTSYYFWPPGWVGNVPGLFTGSAMPMRFMRLDGQYVDVYQAASQMTDESGQSYPFTIDTLLDRANGPEGYYGAFTINAHTDEAETPEAEATVASALARQVPVVSAVQMLNWLDARNASFFSGLAWSGGTLAFTIVRAPAANGLQGMLPYRTPAGILGPLTRGGVAVPYTVQEIKGIEYALFSADAGTYGAAYAPDTTAPAVMSTVPVSGANNVAVSTSVQAVFSEAMDAATLNGSTVSLSISGGGAVSAALSYDTTSRTLTLSPSAALAGGTTYIARIVGGAVDPRAKDVSGNALASDFSWSFTTAAAPPPPSCPCSAWPASAAPGTPSVADFNPVELGVKFTVDVTGFITHLRFYKGNANTGTHIGSLWNSSGTLLGRATFAGESASGWQQVQLPTPVAVQPGNVYVASYFAPGGGYAGDNDFFLASGVDNPPIHLLKDGVSGGNGVYNYGAGPSFPANSFRSSNYWVDVVFNTSVAPDTTPPTVQAVLPGNGSSGVATNTAVRATFSEALQAASVSTATFELRDNAGQPVAAQVGYDGVTFSATLTPSALLAPNTTYTATLRGGSGGTAVLDLAGNPLAADFSWAFTTAPLGGPCASPANPIVAENCLAGSPASEWDVSGSGDASIQGFATDISVNRGSRIDFKIRTDASNYKLDIYRIGYYGGMGARKVATVQPSATLPQAQPDCLNDSATGLIDCGNWGVSASWPVPANATSGVYIAKAVRNDTQGASHIVFVVRDDASSSGLVVQTADTTWQAYNNFGGNSLYTGSPAGRAFKVSYNRPFVTRDVDNGQDWLFNAEYPMIRWLEANGYDLSYITGVDADRFGALIRNHRVYLSSGHDEYWSKNQRAAVEDARGAGVHLAFFSGNEVFWKTRWENSIDGSGTSFRTLVCYKETHANAKIDPSAEWTGTWRDARFSPPADGGRPENALTGNLFMVNDGATTAIRVPEADGKMRFWRNTSIATQATGATATLAGSTLGYEWDVDVLNSARPAGVIRLSTTTVNNAPVLLDNGSTYGSGTAVHTMTLYRHASGALVFGAGTVQWAWGLDANHDRGNAAPDVRMQQATVNLLADMGLQAATLQPGLVAAVASSDTSAPTATISSPAAGSTVATGSTVTISGSATDSGGAVGGVEVSVDDGATWKPANGRASWSFAWVAPGTPGSVTIRARAIDDSGNFSPTGTAVTVNVGTVDTTAPTVTGIAPSNNASNVPVGTAVTATFSEAMDPSTINTTTFTLSRSGTAVAATVNYNASTRVATLQPSSPLAGSTVYTAVVRGGGTDPRVKDLAGNALASNRQWSFTTGVVDTTAPTISSLSPAANATGVARGTSVSVTFSEAMNTSTINAGTFTLTNNSTGAVVNATLSYSSNQRRATLTPSANLAARTTYTARVLGGSSGVADLAGNRLASTRVWSFTTR